MRIKPTIMTWLVATIAVSTVWADDNTVEKVVNANQRITVPIEVPTEVMHIDLPAGLWNVTSGLNAFAKGQWGTYVYFAGAISRYTPNMGYQDGRTAFCGAEISTIGRADPIVPSVGRLVQISALPGETKPVYLMIWVHKNRPSDIVTGASAYGFMEAHRLP